MSPTDPIAPDSPLGRALGTSQVPELPADFADRIVARTKDRAPPLPEIRRGGSGGDRWRTIRRLGLGFAVSGALATAAAATGLLDDLPFDLPTPTRVWNAITGQEAEPAPVASAAIPAKTVKTAPGNLVEREPKVRIEGTIDSPEELEEVFRRIDQVRANRRENRAATIDQRIDRAIERRRAQGLPGPTPEREAQIRERAKQIGDRAETRADQQIEARRGTLRERIEAGEEIAPRELLRQEQTGQRNPEVQRQIEELRALPPAQRRERIRQLREERRLREQMLRQSAPETPAAPSVPEENPQL